MQSFIGFIIYLLPGIAFFLLCCLFYLLNKSARKRRVAAFAIGLMLQMFLPDPKVQHTIELVTEEKKQKKSNKENNRDKNS